MGSKKVIVGLGHTPEEGISQGVDDKRDQTKGLL